VPGPNDDAFAEPEATPVPEPADVGLAPRDIAPALIDSIVADAEAVERWLTESLTAGLTGAVTRVAPAISYDLWLPVARVDAVAQSLAMLDKSWRLAATLVAAADRGSRPEWPLEELLADPLKASLRLVEAETGSFSSVVRASLKSARHSPVKTALAAGGLLAIPPAVADNLNLIFPDRPPKPCPIVTHAAPAAVHDDLVRLLGSQPPGTVVTTTIDFGDGRKAVISGGASRADDQPNAQTARTKRRSTTRPKP
jgi:hypothetical protein